jgi:hypothetical protein
MRKIIIKYLAIGLLFIGCSDKSLSNNFTFMVNNSEHNLAIQVYFQGKINSYKSFFIAPHEKKEINYTMGKNVETSGICYGELLLADSVLVEFDNIASTTHYSKNGIIGGAKKFLLYDSPKNIYNRNSYTKTILSKDETSVTIQFLYTITEDDYIYASQ